MSKDKEFSGLRAILWPIHNYELKKFLPTALIMFCILFNYTVLRDTKDALVVNASGSSAVISFLKLLVTPCAILFVLLYAKLSNIFDSEKIFYVIVTPFLVFFGLFGFVIYPMVDLLHPSKETVEALHHAYPAMHGFIDIYAYWSYSLFYILSEIWGSAMIGLMFWQYANRITRKNEAKRFYGFFSVVANAALIFSGYAVIFCSENIKEYVTAGTEWAVSLKLLCGLVVIMGAASLYLYRWMHTNVLNDIKYYDPNEQGGGKKKKEKLSIMESAKLIFKSPELGYIALLMIGYGITINLVEVQWKYQMGVYFAGDKGAYNAFMGWNSLFTGIFTMIFSWLIGVNVLRRMPWIIPAMVTPLLMVTLGAAFFGFICYQDFMMAHFSSLVTNPVAAALVIGLVAVVSSKSVKYALFDPTKEMAYITLDEELRTKGKAAVDVIGGRAGKAGGAAIQAAMFTMLATKNVILVAPYTGIIFAVICVLWMFAVKGLNKKVGAAYS